jgi:hypothetical protein
MLFRLTQDLRPELSCVAPSGLSFAGPVRACYQTFHIHDVLPSFRHVARQKSIAVTCYTGSVSGATSSILPC